MPFIRRYRPRRGRRPLRRRSVRRWNRRPRQLLARKRPIHTFKRKIDSTLTLDNESDTSTSYIFKLSDLPNSTDFTNLFDSYKINGIRWEMKPRFNSCDVATPGLVPIYTVIDRNDNEYLTSIHDALEYETCKVHKMTQNIKRYFKPAIMSTALSTGSETTLGLQLWNRWISTNTVEGGPNISHLGLKLYANTTGLSNPIVYDVITTYYFQCKAVK